MLEGYGIDWPADDPKMPPPPNSALALGADATRRRKRAAEDPPPLLLLCGEGVEATAGWLAMRNPVWVGLAVCGTPSGDSAACPLRCERDSERYLSPLDLADDDDDDEFSLPVPPAVLKLLALNAGDAAPTLPPAADGDDAVAVAAPCAPK